MASSGNLPDAESEPAFLMVSFIGRWALYLGKKESSFPELFTQGSPPGKPISSVQFSHSVVSDSLQPH